MTLLRALLIGFIFILGANNYLTAQSNANFSSLAAAKEKQLDTFAERLIKEWNTPSLGIGIVKDNELVFAKGYGYRNIEKQLPADGNTIYAIGSSTKAFTAAGVAKLADDGLIKLDEPVIQYLSDFRMSDDYITHHMTARDLLCHRSGLPRHDPLWYGSPDNRGELFSKLQHLEPSAGFREIFQYQNLMFMTAGYLTGRLRNSTWEEEMEKQLFKPLNMNRTNCSVEDSKKDNNHALPYAEEDEKLVAIPFRNLDAVGPAGSINSSPLEMGNWLIMQLNDGQFNGNQVLSANAIKNCQTGNIAAPDSWSPFLAFENGGSPITYGLGWFISNHRGRRIIEHGGTIDGFRTSVAMLPAEKIGVVVFANKAGSSLPQIMRNYALDVMLNETPTDWNAKFLAQKATAEANAEQEKDKQDKLRVKNTQPAHPLKEYAGNFQHDAYGTVKIFVDQNKLAAIYRSDTSLLEHYHYEVFQAEEDESPLKLLFQGNHLGEIDKISIGLEPAVDDIIFKRIADPLNESDIAALLGDYELKGTIIKVWKKGTSTLMMTVPGQPDYTLQPDKANRFSIEGLKGYKVSFDKTGDTVTTLNLHQPNGNFAAKKKGN